MIPFIPLSFFFGERRHLGGRIWHLAKSYSGVDVDFNNHAMHVKNLRQDGGAPLRLRWSFFCLVCSPHIDWSLPEINHQPTPSAAQVLVLFAKSNCPYGLAQRYGIIPVTPPSRSWPDF